MLTNMLTNVLTTIHILYLRIETFILNFLDSLNKSKETCLSLDFKYLPEQEFPHEVFRILTYGGIPFTISVFTNEEYEEFQDEILHKDLPVLIIDGETCLQSQAMLRYVGALTHTYPNKNKVFAALVDQWMELLVKFTFPLSLYESPKTYGLDWWERNRDAYRRHLQTIHIPMYLKMVNKELQHSDFVGGMDRPSVADFCWFESLKSVSEKFDGCIDSFDNIKQFIDRIQNIYQTTIEYDSCHDECLSK